MLVLRRAGLLVATAVLAAGLVACGSSPSNGDGQVRVVASTNVWGDLVASVAGDRAGHGVSITSIISDPSQDPHSYEASAKTRLELSRADLVIENGGGYDDFVDTMLGAGSRRPTVVNAVEVSGKKPVDGELNEHVWYDFPTVVAMIDKISTELVAADGDHADTYRANAKTLISQVQGLEQRAATIKTKHAGEGVAITEPVPLYLLTACGLVNKTPPAFSEAVEAGDDVPVRVMAQTTALFTATPPAVRALVYNAQTAGPETTKLLAAAGQHDVPAVPVTETLPTGMHYVGWMGGILDAVTKALSR